MQSNNVEVLAVDREDKSSVLLLTFRTGWLLAPPPSLPCLLCLIRTVCQPLHGVPLDEVSLELGRRKMSGSRGDAIGVNTKSGFRGSGAFQSFRVFWFSFVFFGQVSG